MLRIKEGSQPYHFFIFTISIFRTLLSVDTVTHKLEEAEKDKALNVPPLIESVTAVTDKLLAAPMDSEEVVTLSVIDMTALLSVIDLIAKMLLGDEVDIVQAAAEEAIPDLKPNWDSDYLKSAQILFEQLKGHLGQLKSFDTLMNFVTRHQL